MYIREKEQLCKVGLFTFAEHRVRKRASNADFGNSEDIAKALLQGCVKEVLEKGEDRYLNFKPEIAVQTTDVIGKHIYEFPRKPADKIPEIFTLLVTYFDMYPEALKTEGLFRVAASMDKVDELYLHIQMENYYIVS